jgi:hypothetical protein
MGEGGVMACYLVTAKPADDLSDLKARLDASEVREMRPFGKALDHALKHARLREDGLAVWEEEDYCSPPLAMEREAVLDTYFHDLGVERVAKGEGWTRIEALPRLWSEG